MISHVFYAFHLNIYCHPIARSREDVSNQEKKEKISTKMSGPKNSAILSVKEHFIDENEIQANVITHTICLACCSIQYFDSSTAA